jgi:hypothetical protein
VYFATNAPGLDWSMDRRVGVAHRKSKDWSAITCRRSRVAEPLLGPPSRLAA